MKRILKFIPMFVMMGVIFFFSQMPGEESAAASGKIFNEVMKIVEQINQTGLTHLTPDKIHWLIRKCAHFTEYAVFGWCTIYALTDLVRNKWVACIFSETIVFLYAISDEFHQHLIPGRYMSAGDVGIDSLGALLGIWLFVLFHRTKKKSKKAVNKPRKVRS